MSIIVPVFNAGQYLLRCLDSLCSQTLREIEILCVNDGSSDHSLEILNERAQSDSRVRVWSQENAGPGAARNKALDNARGRYIMFCDADDTLEPDACRVCADIMEKENIDIVVFNSNIIEIDRTVPCYQDSEGKYIVLVTNNNAGRMNKSDCVKISLISNLWTYCWRRDLIDAHNLRFTDYKATEDGIFQQSYLMLVRSGYAIENVLYNYYVHKGSLEEAAARYGGHWINRLLHLPRLLGNTFVFAVKK